MSKVSYVGVPLIFKIELGLHDVYRAFDVLGIYHVGSSLSSPEWRDIDFVGIMKDEAFHKEFPGTQNGKHFEHDEKWQLITVWVSDWLSNISGAPIDFKFQPMTWANKHKGKRQPMCFGINK